MSIEKDGTIVILHFGNKVLLQLRDSNPKQFPRHWDAFGGRIEDGEKPLDAALREVKEELGLVLTADVLEPIGDIGVVRLDGQAKIHCFATPLQIPLSNLCLAEGDGFALHPQEAIANLQLIPEARLAVERYFESEGFGWIE